jgi:hypothetical protein
MKLAANSQCDRRKVEKTTDKKAARHQGQAAGYAHMQNIDLFHIRLLQPDA